MKKLLSLPPNLVECFHEIENVDNLEWFCTSDPVGAKLGSGGGTTWLLESCYRQWAEGESFDKWLALEKRILLHAGGQSRRLPGYAPSGKILTPIPIFRWAKGQRLNQNLLSLQLPLYERIMAKAPDTLHTLIASGDVYIRTSQPLQPIPEADVVCYGLWVDPSLAKNHGVFVSSRKTPDKLDFMLQKPSVERLSELLQTHLFLMDIGIWLLSDRAVKLLMQRSRKPSNDHLPFEDFPPFTPLHYYDLYSDFGCALGECPTVVDDELRQLKVAVLPLPGGEFYHYGTSRELISSTVAVQNLVRDQREIMHRRVKAHPAMFVQNAENHYPLTADNYEVWIENSFIPSTWQLAHHHIITGVPRNEWNISLPEGVCVDVVPMGEKSWVARPYGFNDAFKGALDDECVTFMGKSFPRWAEERQIRTSDIEQHHDLQAARIFPVVETVDDLGKVLAWMISGECAETGRQIWMNARKLSADEISAKADLRRLNRQREEFRASNWHDLAANYEKSVFYQINLDDAAAEYHRLGLQEPAPVNPSAPLLIRIHDHAFRARLHSFREDGLSDVEEGKAWSLLSDGLTSRILAAKQLPQRDVYSDQIVWGRSPVRIDLAGGWTDTPPYCLSEGGNVVNIAIELNGQPPLQAYVKPCKEYKVILRSIDLGAMEVVSSFEELCDFARVGSPFSIPKAALALAGFCPAYSALSFATLEEQLRAFGSGIEVTLLSAIPAGSGLGTSSILASTVLGAVADFCGLHWDKNEICLRTLALEQLLTTGGGWQDQYGGVLHGAKLLQTRAGFDQSPLVRWLPDFLFTDPEYQSCHLLYYTGITRTAKGILAEIVRRMFLNSTEQLQLLADMKAHALDLAEAVQRGRFEEFGQLVGLTWEQNKRLDAGTNPEAVETVIQRIKDYCLGYKLPGAGGGGYLYMVAKDPEAAARIRSLLHAHPLNERARFVEMTLSHKGLQISRS